MPGFGDTVWAERRFPEKHCGFVINTGDATAEDVMNLIRHVQSEVSRQFGVELEMEVKTLGF